VRPILAIWAAIFLSGAAITLRAQSTPSLKLSRAIALPGVEGRIDHFAIDGSGQRLFVCALGNNTVEVVDLRKGERIHSIRGLGSPQGIGYVPDADRIFVANDRGGICKIYDGKSFQQLGEIDLRDDADNVRYDAAGKKILVGFGSGGIAIIDPVNVKQLGSVKLSAHPEAFALEQNGNRIFANIPNSHHIAVIDRDQGKVIATWRTDLTLANFPIALDETSHRLFVGCRMPATLLVINTDSGAVISKTGISGDCDDVFYDAKRDRVYAVCGAGKVDVIEQKDLNANADKILTSVMTAIGARTGLFAPDLDQLFVAVPHRGPQQAEIRCYDVE